MRALTIKESDSVILGIQDEIRRSDEARYDHRLHGILLVAQGMSCNKVAEVLGDSPRTVANWVWRFESKGLAGLAEGERTGRPCCLSKTQTNAVDRALRKRPTDFGIDANLWDGKTLSVFIRNKWGIELGVRQCQRFFRKLGFRFRKPRPLIARADPEAQKQYKKNS